VLKGVELSPEATPGSEASYQNPGSLELSEAKGHSSPLQDLLGQDIREGPGMVVSKTGTAGLNHETTGDRKP
jgi:hypothetical protein